MRATQVKIVGALLGSALTLAACSGSPSGAARAGAAGSAVTSSTASATKSAPPQHEVLFVALEPAGFLGSHSAVAIVGLDGSAKAKATFAPRHRR